MLWSKRESRLKLAVALAVVGASLPIGIVRAAGAQLRCPGYTCAVSVSGGAKHGTSVAVVGDSITYFSTPYIKRSLKSYRFMIRAQGAQTMAEMYPAIQELLAPSPNAWIIELGTNDAIASTNWVPAFAQEVATLVSQQCVVLVSVNPRLGAIAQSIDEAINQTTVEQSNFHELDWGNIEWDNPSWVRADGVHPTPKGSAKLAALMNQTVHRYC